MKNEKFEELCRQAGCVPVKHVTLDDCEVFIADGFRNSHPGYPHPSYRTIWAISRGGLEVMRDLYIKLGDGDLQARINAAMKDAKLWIDVNVELGRYAK